MEIREDDWASMLAAVEAELERPTIALALGVGQDELDRIAAGMAPRPKVEQRLKLLHALSRETDLRDPQALVAALTRGTRLPRMRTLFIAFAAVDAVIVAAAMLVVLLRG